MMNWSVYIIRASDDSLYTGISTDVERRFREHRDGVGARYFNGRRADAIVYVEQGHNRSTASQREAAIKRLTRAQKLALLSRYQSSDRSSPATLSPSISGEDCR